MKIKYWLEEAVGTLTNAELVTARLDCEILLADSLQKDRSWLVAHEDFELDEKMLHGLDEKIKRRANHEPIAYIRGCQEFYGREFSVSPDTLTPRPETETMIELLLKLPSEIFNSPVQLVDVGTGSGCIIISSALEIEQRYPTAQVEYAGLDISDKALEIAQLNSKKFETNIKFTKMDLKNDPVSSAASRNMPTILLANLPYVPADFHINLAATHEPDFAIFGGADGLDLYRILFEKATDTTLFILTESLPPQHVELAKVANISGFIQTNEQDLIQVFRRIV